MEKIFDSRKENFIKSLKAAVQSVKSDKFISQMFDDPLSTAYIPDRICEIVRYSLQDERERIIEDIQEKFGYIAACFGEDTIQSLEIIGKRLILLRELPKSTEYNNTIRELHLLLSKYDSPRPELQIGIHNASKSAIELKKYAKSMTSTISNLFSIAKEQIKNRVMARELKIERNVSKIIENYQRELLSKEESLKQKDDDLCRSQKDLSSTLSTSKVEITALNKKIAEISETKSKCENEVLALRGQISRLGNNHDSDIQMMQKIMDAIGAKKDSEILGTLSSMKARISDFESNEKEILSLYEKSDMKSALYETIDSQKKLKQIEKITNCKPGEAIEEVVERNIKQLAELSEFFAQISDNFDSKDPKSVVNELRSIARTNEGANGTLASRIESERNKNAKEIEDKIAETRTISEKSMIYAALLNEIVSIFSKNPSSRIDPNSGITDAQRNTIVSLFAEYRGSCDRMEAQLIEILKSAKAVGYMGESLHEAVEAIGNQKAKSIESQMIKQRLECQALVEEQSTLFEKTLLHHKEEVDELRRKNSELLRKLSSLSLDTAKRAEE